MMDVISAGSGRQIFQIVCIGIFFVSLALAAQRMRVAWLIADITGFAYAFRNITTGRWFSNRNNGTHDGVASPQASGRSVDHAVRFHPRREAMRSSHRSHAGGVELAPNGTSAGKRRVGDGDHTLGDSRAQLCGGRASDNGTTCELAKSRSFGSSRSGETTRRRW